MFSESLREKFQVWVGANIGNRYMLDLILNELRDCFPTPESFIQNRDSIIAEITASLPEHSREILECDTRMNSSDPLVLSVRSTKLKIKRQVRLCFYDLFKGIFGVDYSQRHGNLFCKYQSSI